MANVKLLLNILGLGYGESVAEPRSYEKKSELENKLWNASKQVKAIHPLDNVNGYFRSVTRVQEHNNKTSCEVEMNIVMLERGSRLFNRLMPTMVGSILSEYLRSPTHRAGTGLEAEDHWPFSVSLSQIKLDISELLRRISMAI